MFGKTKKSVKRRASGTVDTLVGSSTEINGDVLFSGGLHVDGRIRGKVAATESEIANLSISEQGMVEGDISVPIITVNGTVTGNVYSTEHMLLAGNARVSGNVYYNKLEIQPGAEVNGQMVHDPLGDHTPSSNVNTAAMTKVPMPKDAQGVPRVKLVNSGD